ncbi:MAG: hypothetical protein HQL68_04580 [Magnetococcales bacterium]|nr:hypothetical protein [Magnetococcales bacterium]
MQDTVKIIGEGQSAHAQGVCLSANPYQGGEDHDDWSDGWQLAANHAVNMVDHVPYELNKEHVPMWLYCVGGVGLGLLIIFVHHLLS